jgi:hypothetical protein
MIRGYETMIVIEKGKLGLPQGCHMEQVRFIEEVFGIAA